MKKICNWILNGKGRGKRYLLLFSFLFSVMICSIIYISWNNILNVPRVKEIMDDIPEVKVEDGILTAPKNAYYQISWDINDTEASQEKKYHFIIDTRQTQEINPKKISQNGIYLTHKNLYILSNNSLTRLSLENFPDLEIKKGTLFDALRKGALRFCVILCVALTLIFFINLYIWSLIYALFSYLLTLLFPFPRLSFASRRRLSVLSLICAYVLILPVSLENLYNLIFLLFVLVLAFMGFFLMCLPKNLIISVDK